MNLDEHEATQALPDWVKTIITRGKDPSGYKVFASPSEAVFAIACEMVRAEVPDEIIVSIITDPLYRISEHILQKENVDREVRRVLSRAHDFVIDPLLASLNPRHAVTQLEGKTVVMGWQRSEINVGVLVPYFQSFDDFRKLHK